MIWSPSAAGLSPSPSPAADPRSQSPLLLALEQTNNPTPATGRDTFTHILACTSTVDPSRKRAQIRLQRSIPWISFSPVTLCTVPRASKQSSKQLLTGIPCSQLTAPWFPPISTPDLQLLQNLTSKCQILPATKSGLMVASDLPLTYTLTWSAHAPLTPVAGTTDTWAPVTPSPNTSAGIPESKTHEHTQNRELLTQEKNS